MTTDSAARFASILPMLVCPACRHALRSSSDALRCTACAAEYPIVKGRPVFVPAGRDVRVIPEGHISNQPVAAVMDRVAWQKGWTLNLGAGGTVKKLDNVVEFEYALFKNTDVSGDAHHLPFPDATFESVVTFNTFEHLADPDRAAAEIYRVLKPGGWLFLHTAFLQPLHESPYHFYNTTEWGLRKWFAQFQIQDVNVSSNFHPGYTLAFLASTAVRAAESQGPEVRKLVGHTTLDYWASCWGEPKNQDTIAWNCFATLSQELQKAFSAGFQLEATKPAG